MNTAENDFVDRHRNGLFSLTSTFVGAVLTGKAVEFALSGTATAAIAEGATAGAAFVAAGIFAVREFSQGSQSEQ